MVADKRKRERPDRDRRQLRRLPSAEFTKATTKMRPVVLIPGIGGSVLVKQGQTHKKFFRQKLIDNRWINLTPFSKRSVKQWKEDMTYGVRRDPVSKRIVGFDGYESRGIVPYDIGGTAGIKDLVSELVLLNQKQQDNLESMYQVRYFNTLCESLYAKGYADGKTLIGLPYDFRLVLDPEYRRRLFNTFRTYIENAVADSRADGADGAVVVGHSLGALLFKWFLSTGDVSPEWIAENVAHFVSICAPYGGAPESMKACLAGEHYIPLFHQVFREELEYNSGIIMCFPNSIGTLGGEVLYELPAAEAGGADKPRQIRLGDYGDLADGGAIPFEIWRDLFAPHIPVIERKISVPVTAVLTVNVATAARFRTRKLSAYPYDTAYGYGDGVVPARSLKSYRKLFGGELCDELLVPNSNHAKLISDPRVCRLVQALALRAPAGST